MPHWKKASPTTNGEERLVPSVGHYFLHALVHVVVVYIYFRPWKLVSIVCNTHHNWMLPTRWLQVFTRTLASTREFVCDYSRFCVLSAREFAHTSRLFTTHKSCTRSTTRLTSNFVCHSHSFLTCSWEKLRFMGEVLLTHQLSIKTYDSLGRGFLSTILLMIIIIFMNLIVLIPTYEF